MNTTAEGQAFRELGENLLSLLPAEKQQAYMETAYAVAETLTGLCVDANSAAIVAFAVSQMHSRIAKTPANRLASSLDGALTTYALAAAVLSGWEEGEVGERGKSGDEGKAVNEETHVDVGMYL